MFLSLAINPAHADKPSVPIAAASLICVVHTLIVHSSYQLRGVGVAQIQCIGSDHAVDPVISFHFVHLLFWDFLLSNCAASFLTPS